MLIYGIKCQMVIISILTHIEAKKPFCTEYLRLFNNITSVYVNLQRKSLCIWSAGWYAYPVTKHKADNIWNLPLMWQRSAERAGSHQHFESGSGERYPLPAGGWWRKAKMNGVRDVKVRTRKDKMINYSNTNSLPCFKSWNSCLVV